jgi:hypothetical protein
MLRCLAVCVLLVTVSCSLHAQSVSNERITVSATGAPGRFVGFSVRSGAAEVAAVTFGSNGAITASSVKAGPDSLRFTGLSCAPTPRLGPGSSVEVKLLPGDLYPEVSFQLDLQAFDQTAWEARFGQVPFHFLACSVPGAEVFHQRGWSIGTPVIDDYIQMKAERNGRTIVSAWSRDWMYAPPIGAYPVAVAGLWNSTARRYVGYDFHGARLTDHTEKDFGTTYCWQCGDSREFFCLTWPYGDHYIRLRYPQTPVQVGTHFRLLWSDDMGPDDDPNLMVTDFLWRNYADLLPDAERMNDLSWLPGSMRISNFPPPGAMGRFAVHNVGPTGERWWAPNVNLIGGLNYLNSVGYYFQTGNQAAIQTLGEECRKLVNVGRWMDLGGERCFVWDTPLDGGGADFFGPGVQTFRHVKTWQAGLALLEYYCNDPQGAADILPYVDGVLRTTKHILYTRNCYPDVPAAQFAWSATPAVTFCLRYYYYFRNDPTHRELADLAYKLSRNMTYRYMALWASDNDDSDDLDAAFLMEPNAGLPWLGCACANEIWVYNVAMLYEYLSTGDPIMGHYVRGMLERYPVMFQDQWYPTVAQYPSSAFTERLGLYDECAQGRGKRADYGGLWGGFEHLIWPVGSATVRVACGEKAAMAFNRNGRHTDIAEYRYYGDGNVSFKLVPGGLQADPDAVFDLTVGFPFFTLRGKQVVVIRGDQRTALGPDRITDWPAEPSTINIRGLKLGDVVCIGSIERYGTVDPLPCATQKPRQLPPDSADFIPQGDFRMLNLARGAFEGISRDWDNPGSLAGYLPGLRTVWGVPFTLLDPELTKNRVQVPRRGIAFGENPQTLFVLLGAVGDRSRLALYRDDGTREEVDLNQSVPAITAWPPLYTWALNLVAIDNGGKPIVSLAPTGCQVFAVTWAQQSTPKVKAALASIAAMREEELARKEMLKGLQELEPLFARFSGHIAVLPSGDTSNPRTNALVKMLQEAGLAKHLVFLTPRDLVNPAVFNTRNAWIALYLGGEAYCQNVARPGDGDDALRNWLKGGGTLVALPSQPFPFYYNEADKPVVSAGKFGLPINGSGATDQLKNLDVAVTGGWETPPAGVQLTFHVDPNQATLTHLPATIPWPAEGDQRWRPIFNVVGKDNVYTPLITLRDQAGRSYGDGAAMIDYSTGDLAGARVVYVWNTLRNMTAIQRPLLADLIRYLLTNTVRPPSEITCVRASTPPVIDGKLDDPAWQQAQVTEPFTRFDPDRGDGKDLQTTARLTWDDQNLYVAWEAQDPDVWSDLKDRDAQLWENEVVELYVDPNGDGKDYLEIEVNPRNAVVDLKIPGAQKGVPLDVPGAIKWNAAGLRTAVSVAGTADNREDTDTGWTVELAIPWSNFADQATVPPRVGDAWRMQLYRIDRSNRLPHPQFSGWSTTDTFHDPARFGRVTFAGNPLADDFSTYADGSAPGAPWAFGAGEWQVKGGVLEGRNSGGGGFAPVGAAFGDPGLKDYALSVRFRIRSRGSDHRDGAWIGVRYAGTDTNYAVCFHQGLMISKNVDGRSTGDNAPLARVAFTPDDQWHQAVITVEGARLTVALDGKQLAQVTDDNALGTPALASGGVCLSARRWENSTGDTVVDFDDLRIEPLP